MALLPSGDPAVASSLTHPATTAAAQKTNFTSLRTFLSDLFGTDSSNKVAARAALGAASAGAVTTSGLTQSSARLLGRTTAGTGAVEEISVGSGFTLAAGVLSTDAAQIISQPNPTLAASALTLPASTLSLAFRSATASDGVVPATVTGTVAALTIPSGATLGTVSDVASSIIEVVMNNAGALERAVVNLAGGNDLSETGFISTTAISAAATSASVFYSNTARANLPYRVVRRIDSTQATAGAWVTSPSLVQGVGGRALAAMSSFGHGQCLLEYVSTTQIRLKQHNGNRLTVNGVSCSVPDAPLTLAATGLQPVFASTNRSITTNVATITHTALAAALPVGSQVLALDIGGAEAYNGLKTVTASTTTSTSYAAVATNEASVADTVGRITPIYNTYAVATTGAVSSIEASLTARATSTATGNKGVEIKTGDETRTFVGTFTVAAGLVFANNVQSWFNGRPRSTRFDVAAARVTAVSYPNPTNLDMLVVVTSGTSSGSGSLVTAAINGKTVSSVTNPAINTQMGISFTVPPGESYVVTSLLPLAGALWFEYRQI